MSEPEQHRDDPRGDLAWGTTGRLLSQTADRIPGGFSTVYPVLKAAEESGRTRRGYFVEGLGAAQFAIPGAVDRLRSHARPDDLRERFELSRCEDELQGLELLALQRPHESPKANERW